MFLLEFLSQKGDIFINMFESTENYTFIYFLIFMVPFFPDMSFSISIYTHIHIYYVYIYIHTYIYIYTHAYIYIYIYIYILYFSYSNSLCMMGLSLHRSHAFYRLFIFEWIIYLQNRVGEGKPIEPREVGTLNLSSSPLGSFSIAPSTRDPALLWLTCLRP